VPLTDKVVKLPLNDTIAKDDPNSFANKLRDAVLKYDAEKNNKSMNSYTSKIDLTR
jgi:hypothetical protein